MSLRCSVGRQVLIWLLLLAFACTGRTYAPVERITAGELCLESADPAAGEILMVLDGTAMQGGNALPTVRGVPLPPDRQAKLKAVLTDRHDRRRGARPAASARDRRAGWVGVVELRV